MSISGKTAWPIRFRVGLVGVIVLSGLGSVDCAGTKKAEGKADEVACVKELLGIELPPQARAVRCHSEVLMVMLVYVRFEAPRDEVVKMLQEQRLFRGLPVLERNPEIWSKMSRIANTVKLDWWAPAGEPEVVCAETERIAPGQSSNWICHLDVAMTSEDGDWVTFFLQYSEEPVSKTPIK